MKNSNSISVFIGLGLAAVAAQAADLTWDHNADGTASDGAGTWLNANQWWDGAANTNWTSGDNASFGNAGTGAGVTLATPTTVGSFTFNQFSGTYTLGTSGNTITLNSGITKNASSAAVTFASPITLSGPQTWVNNSGGTLATGNGVNLIDNNGNQLAIDGSGSTTFGVVNSTAIAITGSGALVKNGSGLLSVGGANSGFTGDVSINGGVLKMVNNTAGLGSGNINLTDGVLEAYWGLTLTRTMGAGPDEVQVTGGTSGFSQNGAAQTFTITFNNNAAYEVVWGTNYFNPSVFVLASPYSQNSANAQLSNKLDLNGATRTIYVAGGTGGTAKGTIAGQIRNSTGTAGLTKTGGGALFIVSTASAWNGATTIDGGWLDFGGINIDANIGGGTGVRDITVATGAGVRFNTLNNTVLNRIVETNGEITVMTGSSANLDFSSSTGANLPGAFLSNYAGNGAKMEYSGTITPGGGAYRLGSLFQSGALGIRQESLLSGTNQVIIGGNRVVIVGAHTFTGGTTIRDGGRLGLAAYTGGTNSLALQNSTLDLGAPSATGDIFLEAASNAPITGSNPSTNGGTLSATFGGLKGSRNLYSAFLFTNPGNNTAATVATNITGFTVNVAAGTTNTYSGAIGGFGTGASGSAGGASTLTKTGLGTQILTGTNTYTGETRVEAGTLGLSGSNILPDATAVLWVASGANLDLATGVNETIYRLYLNDGQTAAVGTWGGPASSAQFRDFIFFTGTGVVNVTSTDTGATPYNPAHKGTILTIR